MTASDEAIYAQYAAFKPPSESGRLSSDSLVVEIEGLAFRGEVQQIHGSDEILSITPR
jgi:hypothetical protein